MLGMRNSLLLLLAIFCTSLAFAEPTKVGAILPLSSDYASWGDRVRIGLETANELHGNKFSIVFEDEGACEAQKALTRRTVGVQINRPRLPLQLLYPSRKKEWRLG